jgi:hypothetical protein
MVIDNGSRDGSADKIRKEFPHVKLIVNSENLGFAEGNNIGIREALKERPDHILLLNNDVVVKPDFLSGLVKAAGSETECGIFGPKIYYLNNPNMIWFAGVMMSRWTGKPYNAGINRRDNVIYSRAKQVDFISGCAMLIRAQVFNDIGLLDADYFNNTEEVDFCLRATANGHRSYYVPSSVIYHKVSSSMGGMFSPFYVYYQTRNILLLNKKNHISKMMFWPSILLSFSRRIVYFALTGRFESIIAVFLGLKDFFKGIYGKSKAFSK